MQNDRISDQHVGERLSGYLDGELTQQERQRIDLHLEACDECMKLLGELTELTVPDYVDGVSLVPQLKNPDAPVEILIRSATAMPA